MLADAPTPEEIELYRLRRQVELETRLATLRRDNALEFFVPHEKQTLFYAAAHFHYRYARTGNRFGKSEMGAAEDIAFALGYRPWYPVGHVLRTWGLPAHPTKGVILTTDWDKSEEVFTSYDRESDGGGWIKGKLFKYIPKSALGQPIRNHSSKIEHIPVRHISGAWSHIYLDTVQSFKQNALAFESSTWDWAHIDEPIPEAMWKAIARGLVDRSGKAWFTCTPLREPWIDKKFIPELEDQITDVLPEISDDSRSTWMMTGRMDDNPHNSPAAIERFMQDLSPEERNARRNGLPLSYSGLVYNEFSHTTHVRHEPPVGWKSWDVPPADHCIYIALDYHFKKPNAILFIAVPPDGPVYVFHEIWQKSILEDEVASIRSVLRGRPYQPILVDPLASTPNKVNDLTAMDEYRKAGLAVWPATKDPVNGVRAVRALLKARDKRGGPCIIFNKACKQTLFEIARGYVMDDENNKPEKKNDDMMENLYRLVLQGLQYIEPVSDEDFSAPSTDGDLPSNVISPWEFDSQPTKTRRNYANRYRS